MLARIEGNPWVIAVGRRGEPLKGINPYWYRLRERAGLEDLRLHDCRHSFASQALVIGEGLPTIARLLGHKTVMTTYRYAHLAEDSEKASVARVGDSIGNDLLSGDDGVATLDGDDLLAELRLELVVHGATLPATRREVPPRLAGESTFIYNSHSKSPIGKLWRYGVETGHRTILWRPVAALGGEEGDLGGCEIAWLVEPSAESRSNGTC